MVMRPFLIGLALLVFFLSGCEGPAFFEENRALPSEIWHVDNVLEFTTNVEDTAAVYDFFLNIRHTGQYPYSNLYVFLDTEFPDQTIYKDTLECRLCDPGGRWYGSGLGDLLDLRVLFKLNTKLPQPGTYTIRLEQAMRQAELPHIKDIGLRVEKKS